MNEERPTNYEIAEVLERVADLLQAQEGDPFRIRAYRRASKVIEQCNRPVAELARGGGHRALESLPDIGRSMAAAIIEFIYTGRLRFLERLEGEVSPIGLFASVPGIGPKLARQIYEKLNIETLEELELACYDGRLDQIEGLGARRIRAIRDVLAGILTRAGRRRARTQREAPGRPEHPRQPSVGAILAVDRQYRAKAEAGTLRKIAPKRFNPEGEAWLPVYHIDREGWYFTALFSNTARAHELGRTHDWVVVFYERDGVEGQNTVVTELHGSIAGKRVVRGREKECEELYRHAVASREAPTQQFHPQH